MEMNTQELVQLVESAKAGNRQAYEYLYNTYYNDVYYTCLKLLGDEKNAEDMTQDTFVEVLVSINTLNNPEKFQSWLTKIAAHKSLDFLRKNNRLISADNEELDKFADIEDFEVSFENRIIDSDVKTTLEAIMNRLPEIQRNTLFLFYYRNMSIKEIAELYSCPESTVKSRLAYARKFMKAQIEEFQNQGYKLRCNAALPFLAAIFRAEQNSTAISPSAVPQTVVSTAASAAGNTGSMTVQTAAAAGLSTGGKIAIAGIITAVVVTGGIIAAVTLLNGQSDLQSNLQSDIQIQPSVTESIIAESSAGNDSDTAIVSQENFTDNSFDTELSEDSRDSDDVSLKDLAERMKTYTAEYINFGYYQEKTEDEDNHYHIQNTIIESRPKAADKMIFDLELPNDLKFSIDTPYSELRAKGYVSENYDEDMVENGYTKYIYVFNQSIGKSLYLGISNYSSESAAVKDCKISAFQIENDDRYPDFNYHGITKQSSMKDVVEIFGEPNEGVYITANQYEDSTINLVYQNDNRKKLKIQFSFDKENNTAVFSSLKIT